MVHRVIMVHRAGHIVHGAAVPIQARGILVVPIQVRGIPAGPTPVRGTAADQTLVHGEVPCLPRRLA